MGSLTPLRGTQVEHVWSVSSFRIVVAHKNGSFEKHICIARIAHLAVFVDRSDERGGGDRAA
jgi:hypothetical protein